MQYLLMIYSEENGWNQMTDSERQQGVAVYQAYTESLKKAEVLVGANRLQHTNTATTVRLVDGKPQVLDGLMQQMAHRWGRSRPGALP
jgi:hypothetical protein